MAEDVHPPDLKSYTPEMAVLGGAVLGSGGGGRLEAGLCISQEIADMTGVALRDAADYSPHDEFVILSLFRVSGLEGLLQCPPPHHQAIELLQKNTGMKIAGIIPGGHGAVDSLVGWIEAQRSDIPLVDAVLNPFLHPSPLKALIQQKMPSAFAFVGDATQGDKLKLFSPSATPLLLQILYQHALAERISIAVAIGPISNAQLHLWGRMGRIRQELELGRAMIEKAEDEGEKTVAVIKEQMPESFHLFCVITDIHSKGNGEHRYLHILLRDEENRFVEIFFWHRYIALSVQRQQIAFFPDGIAILGIKGTPLGGNELGEGQEVFVVVMPSQVRAQQHVYEELSQIGGLDFSATLMSSIQRKPNLS